MKTNKRNPRPTYGSDADSSIDNALTFSDKGSSNSTYSSQHGYPESYNSRAYEKSQNWQDTYNEMGRIINLVNGHNRPHVDHKIVQHLEASQSANGDACSTTLTTKTTNKRQKTDA